MAKLTDTLQTERQGMETVNPGPASPSIFEGLAKSGSMFINAQQEADRVNRTRDATARQAQLDAARAAEDNAGNALAGMLFDTYQGSRDVDLPSRPAEDAADGPIIPGVQDAIDAAKVVGEESSTAQAAVSQGRMTKAAYQLKLEQGVRQLFSQFPDQRGFIYKTLKEWGVNHPIMREYDAIAAQETALTDAVTKGRAEAIEYAVTSLGMDPTQSTQGQLEQAGRQAIQAEKQLEVISKRTDIASKNATMTRDEYNFERDQNSDDTYNNVVASFGPKLAGFNQRVHQLMNMQGVSDSDKQKGLEELVRAGSAAGQDAVNSVMIKYGHLMTDDRRSELRTQLNGYVTQLQDVVTGELSVVASNTRNLTNIQNNLKLTMQEALPVYTGLKAAFGNEITVLQPLIDSIMADSEIQKNLSRELKGFNGLSQPKQVATINQVVAIIKGEAGFKDFTPEQAAAQMPLVVNHYRGIAPAAVTGKDVPANAAAINVLNELSGAAVELNQTSSHSALKTATALITNPNTQQILQMGFNGANQAKAKVAIGGARAAAQNLLESWKGFTTNDPYYDVKYNEQKNVYEAVRNKTPGPQNTAAGRFGVLPGLDFRSTEPKPSTLSIDKALGLNNSTRFLVNSTPMDDKVNMKGATGKDLVKFYTEGKPLPSMKPKPEGGEKPTAKTFNQLVKEATADALNFDNGLTFESDYQGKPGTIATRNNNPGNLRPSSFTRSQAGFAGESGGFARFESRQAGHQAHVNLLQNYFNKGRNTLKSIVSRYAPGSDNNDEGAYVSFLEKKLGVRGDETLAPGIIGRLATAMQQMEG